MTSTKHLLVRKDDISVIDLSVIMGPYLCKVKCYTDKTIKHKQPTESCPQHGSLALEGCQFYASNSISSTLMIFLTNPTKWLDIRPLNKNRTNLYQFGIF